MPTLTGGRSLLCVGERATPASGGSVQGPRGDMTGRPPFNTNHDEDILRICTVIHAATAELLVLGIQRELHTLFSPHTSTKDRLAHRSIVANAGKYIAVIHGLVHSGPNGALGAKKQYIEVLGDMSEYATDPATLTGARLASADNLPPVIANAPSPASDRKWSNGKSYPARKRYCSSVQARNAITSFIERFRAELALIPAGEENEPLKQSRINVGWTSKAYGRRDQHYSHSNQTASVAYIPRPISRNIFLCNIVLSHVSDPADAAPAEDVWSTLTGSYVWVGGLNGKNGGDDGMATKVG
ncbi:hypothetical protein BKA61DRAFT_670707 [Leptodontidium sp. MPI-SDFR-AT-0119]|nr:hypothetical protein BKA61DRAFT_670707 [Leptodontidium sp. MPI-SDFR-AT-0119]